MDIRLLVIKLIAKLSILRLTALSIATATMVLSPTVFARQEIRFYEANRHLQTDRVSFTRKKAAQPGCHNFLKRTRVFQANQLGYQSCSLYSEKDCAPESIVEVERTKDNTPITSLSQGFSWFPIDENERGSRLRSWSCELSTSDIISDSEEVNP